MKKNGRAKSVLSIIVVIMILAIAGFVGYKFFQVKNVLVEGNNVYGTEYIVGLANIPDETHMLKVDEDQIKTNIESNPYLELVSVEYEIPDTVLLTVKEREPVALVVYAENNLLVDRLLNVLEMNSTENAGKYPIVQGIVIDAVNLGMPISSQDSFKLSVATSILDEIAKQEATDLISVIDLSDINNIMLQTNNGPDVLFGQGDAFENKIRWIKKILPSLIRDGKTYGIVDVTAGTFATYRLNESVTEQGTVITGEEESASATAGAEETSGDEVNGAEISPSSEVSPESTDTAQESPTDTGVEE